MQVFLLPAAVDIAAAAQLADALRDVTDVDGSLVTRVDAIGLQLLASAARSRRLVWHDASPVLVAAADALHLTTALGLAGAREI